MSGELGCVEEMLTVASYLQVQSVWESSRGRQRQLDEIKERFAVAEGDAVTALNVHAAWCKAGGAAGGGRERLCGEEHALPPSVGSSVRHSRTAGPARSTRRPRRVVFRARSRARASAMTAGFFANAAILAPHGGGAEGPRFEPFEEARRFTCILGAFSFARGQTA